MAYNDIGGWYDDYPDPGYNNVPPPAPPTGPAPTVPNASLPPSASDAIQVPGSSPPIWYSPGTGLYYDNVGRNIPPPNMAPGQNTAPPPATTTPPPGGTFSRDWFRQQVAGKPYTQQTLLDLEGALQGVGSKLTPANTSGERTKIWDPTINQWVRVGFGEPEWTWVPQGGTDTGAPGTGGPGLGSFVAPFTGQPPPGWIPPAGSEFPGDFTYPDFTRPTQEEAFNDPGYQFGVNEGERALVQSSAGRGTRWTGGTLKDILNYGRAAANTQYDDVLNRNLTIWDKNRANQFGNYGSDYTRRNDIYNRGWNEYLSGHDIFTGGQDSAFEKFFRTTQLGQQAAG